MESDSRPSVATNNIRKSDAKPNAPRTPKQSFAPKQPTRNSRGTDENAKKEFRRSLTKRTEEPVKINADGKPIITPSIASTVDSFVLPTSTYPSAAITDISKDESVSSKASDFIPKKTKPLKPSHSSISTTSSGAFTDQSVSTLGSTSIMTMDHSNQPGRKAVRQEKKRRLSKEIKHFIHNVEVKYQIVDPDRIDLYHKRYNDFDGVYWKNSIKQYFTNAVPNWPPRTCFHFFWTKGYYKDWADHRKNQFQLHIEEKDTTHLTTHKSELRTVLDNSSDSDDDEEARAMLQAKEAKRLGLREAEDWESYDSISSDGKVERKLRRKSLKARAPKLYYSHKARKAAREKKKLEKKGKQLKPMESHIHIKDPTFIQDLLVLGSKLDSVDEKDLAKVLPKDKEQQGKGNVPKPKVGENMPHHIVSDSESNVGVKHKPVT